MNIREAETGDAGSVLQLHRAVLEEEAYFITLPSEYNGSVYSVVQQIRACARHDSSLFLVAVDDDVLKGFMTVRGGQLTRMYHTGKLEIMVGPEFRGEGIGRQLMEACMRWARDTPAIEKLGLSVFTTNARAIALYKDMGFEQEGLRKREFRMKDGTYRDDILMYCFVD
jgi:ribosomal protein S18 acetylase RimI-like enzyme